MVDKTDEVMTTARKSHRYFKNFGPSNPKYVSDNLLIDMMLKEQTHIYTGGAGVVRRLRRGDGLADDLRGDRLEIRRPVGNRRRHGLQHGLHVDLSVQPLSRSLDQLALRECAGLCHRRTDALGPDGLARSPALVPGR